MEDFYKNELYIHEYIYVIWGKENLILYVLNFKNDILCYLNVIKET
jgi:hypothetical protein